MILPISSARLMVPLTAACFASRPDKEYDDMRMLQPISIETTRMRSSARLADPASTTRLFKCSSAIAAGVHGMPRILKDVI